MSRVFMATPGKINNKIFISRENKIKINLTPRHGIDAFNDGLCGAKVSAHKSELSKNNGHTIALAWHVSSIRYANVLRHISPKEIYTSAKARG